MTSVYFDFFYRDSYQQYPWIPSILSEDDKKLFVETISQHEAVIIYYENGEMLIQGMPIKLANYIYHRFYN